MKRNTNFKISFVFFALSLALAATSPAWADMIRGIDIDFVTIGNPGNSGDTRTDYPYSADPYGCGAVDYEYRIGMYEITNAQWNAFVSAIGPPTGNPITAYELDAYWTDGSQPTNCVSWYEAAQFCNYLTSGDKSHGAYLFSGDNTNPGDFLGIDRGSAVLTYGVAYVIPTEDEWYKAAYYTGSGYSTYSNGTDTSPIAGTDSNYDLAIGQPWDVGTGKQEQNGTYNIMGNVCEWNETLTTSSARGLRGGSYYHDAGYLASHYRGDVNPVSESKGTGLRVVSVPEPTILVMLSLGGLILQRKRNSLS